MWIHNHWCAPADNVELGTACGKLHRVSVLAITDAGALPFPPEPRLHCCLDVAVCFKGRFVVVEEAACAQYRIYGIAR